MSKSHRIMAITIPLALVACSGSPTTAPKSTPVSSREIAPAPAAHPQPIVFYPVSRESETPGVAADGFPTGQGTAEGAACDLARSFINPNPELFRKVCYARTRRAGADEYNDFLDEMAAEIARAKGMPIEQAGGPKSIGRVFKARNLTANGPASFGFAALSFTEVQFVDIETPLWNGGTFTNRTLVVQSESSGQWFVIPRPDLFDLLSQGLNQESRSTELWTAPGK